VEFAFSQKEKKTVILGAVLLVIAAFFSTGFHQIDEHFQILEFAGLKLGLTTQSELPWEYHQRLRPALQPYIAILVFKMFSLVGLENPFFVSTTLRVLSASLDADFPPAQSKSRPLSQLLTLKTLVNG